MTTMATPPADVPGRLMDRGTTCWTAAERRPPPEFEPFVTAATPFHELPWDNWEETGTIMNDRVVAAASCLLGVRWEILESVGQMILRDCPETDVPSKAVAVLLAASYRQTIPDRLPHDAWLLQRQRVMDAVLFLVDSDEQRLTAAARQVLLGEPETPGERWVMEVIKAACRVAALGFRHEKLKPVEGHYGILSKLPSAKAEEWLWLGPREGDCWPYRWQERQYIDEQYRASGVILPWPKPCPPKPCPPKPAGWACWAEPGPD